MPMTEAQKQAVYRYRQKNRDKINAQAKKDYEKIKLDPERLDRRRDNIRKNKKIDVDNEFLAAILN
jgi:hypothetical protein